MKAPNHYHKKRLTRSILDLLCTIRPGLRDSSIYQSASTYGWPSNEGFHSQGGQDRFIDHYLTDGKREGVFIEIGANDGVTLSNSLYFEERLGWTGACIEPNPARYDLLVKNRPTADTLRVCIGDESGEADFPIVEDAEESLYAHRGKGGSGKTAKTEVIDLPELFERLGYDRIDYLSIDIEGGETEVAGTLARTPLRPTVVGLDENDSPRETDKVMASLGYRFAARIWPDRIYVVK